MAEIWITPKTWAVDTILPAADLNLQMRNNFEWLKNPVTGVAAITTDITTSSTTFVDATGLSVTLTTVGDTVLAAVTMSAGTTTVSAQLTVDLHDGAGRQGGSEGLVSHLTPSSGLESNFSFVYLITGLTPGSNTIKVQWRVSTGTGTIHATNQSATLRIMEIG